MKKHIHTKIIISIVVICVLGYAGIAQAQTLNIDYPAIPIPGPDGVVYFDINDAVRAEKLDIIGLLIYIYAIIIWLAAIITFILLIYTSTRFIVAGSSSGERNRAKKRFYNITWGVLIVLFSWFLLNFVNPDITDIEQSLFIQGIFDTNPVYESPNISTHIEGGQDPAIAGTFSCEWSGDSCTNVEPNNCNSGYFPINCANIEGADFCNATQGVACTKTVATSGDGGGEEGSCYDKCAAEGKSFSECTALCGGSGDLITPPGTASNCTNRDGFSCSGGYNDLEAGCYYELPDGNPEYTKNSNRSQWGNMTLLQVVYTAAYNWNASTGLVLGVSDFNKTSCNHATHHNGAHGDIWHSTATNMYQIASSTVHRKNAEELVKAIIDTGAACALIFQESDIRAFANEYFESKNFSYSPRSSSFAYWSEQIGGHDTHFHLAVKNPDGTCTR